MAQKAVAEQNRKDADKPELAEKTVTVQGMKVTISTTAMKDVDVIEALDDLNSGRNEFAIITVFKSVFGNEQYKDIKAHLRWLQQRQWLAHLQPAGERQDKFSRFLSM